MSDEANASTVSLGRQPDPAPPEAFSAPPPSFVLYALLLAAAAVMVAVAFTLRAADWPGLLLNLGSEIAGAVAILILVDRKFRAREVQVLQRLPQTTREVVTRWLLQDQRQVLGYAHTLRDQISVIARPFYISRPELEAELITSAERGVVLLGAAGMGKTTLLHQLIQHQALQVIKEPTSARVPVLVPAREWRGTTDLTEVLRRSMQRYYPIPARRFRHLLETGRLMCVFDGLDEVPRPESAVHRLREFHDRYPSSSLVVSIRAKDFTPELLPGLPALEVPPLSPDEVRRLLALRRRFGEEP